MYVYIYQLQVVPLNVLCLAYRELQLYRDATEIAALKSMLKDVTP